jgi:hypothetical protein
MDNKYLKTISELNRGQIHGIYDGFDSPIASMNCGRKCMRILQTKTEGLFSAWKWGYYLVSPKSEMIRRVNAKTLHKSGFYRE